MREIKFRAKSRIGNNWKYGFLTKTCEDSGDKYWIDVSDKDTCNDSYEVDPDTVGQYTGLTDKNGEKIFEGDILLCYGTQKVVVSFKNGQYVISHYALNLLWGRSQDCEVIGNVYDNPEMIKENEDE